MRTCCHDMRAPWHIQLPLSEINQFPALSLNVCGRFGRSSSPKEIDVALGSIASLWGRPVLALSCRSQECPLLGQNGLREYDRRLPKKTLSGLRADFALYVCSGRQLAGARPNIIGIVGGRLGLRQAEQVRELERQRVSFPILMNLVAVLVQPSAAIAFVDVRSVEVRVACAGQQ
jgi:hypothetical protein